jgi:MFS family permease
MNDVQNENHHLSDAERKKISREGWRVLIGGMIITLYLGTFYLWGGISKYVASYFHQFDETITASQVSGVFPYMNLCLNAMVPVGVKVAGKIGYKTTFIIGTLIVSVAIFTCSFITHFTLFVFVYAIIFGLCNGIMYMLPVQCGLKYFPNSKGMITGLVFGSYVIGSFIFNFVTLAIVNPDNHHPDEKTHFFDEDVANRVPKMFKILSICYLAIGLFGSMLIKYPKDLHMELYDDHHDNFVGDGKKHVEEVIHNDCDSVKEGLVSRPFIFMFVMAFFSGWFGLLIANSYKLYGFDLKKQDSFLTLTGSLKDLSNGLSRAMWGLLMDKFGFKKCYFVILVIQLSLAVTFSSVSDNNTLFLVWVCATMCVEGGQFSIFPAQSIKIFGHKVGSIMYGLIMNAFAFSNLAAFLIMNNLQPSIGWSGLWWIGFVFSVIALVISLFYKQEHNWKRKSVTELAHVEHEDH